MVFWQKAYLWGTLVFFLAVPLVAMITWIVRRLMKVRSQNRYLGWTFGGLWTLGWISMVLFAASLTKDFRNYDQVAQELSLAQPAMNKLTVRVDEPRIRYSGTFDWINDDDHNDGGWDLTEDSLRMANVNMRILKSPDANYHVTLWKYSRGRNRNDAAMRAERVTYTASTMDSALVLGSGFGVGKAQKFRAQRVIVEIKIPVGKQIRFDESVQQKLKPTYINNRNNTGRWNNNDWERDWDNDDHYSFEWMPNVDYTMTENGELVDLAKPAVVPNNGGVYEYNDTTTRSLDSRVQQLQRQREELIEKQRRKVEEENRRLEEMQNNADATSDQRTGKTTRNNVRKPVLETTGIHTPVFSLIL